MRETSKSFTSSPPEPPPKMSVVSEVINILVIGMLSSFATKAFFDGDWIIFSVDIVLIALNIYFHMRTWASYRKIKKIHTTLKELHDISSVPFFRHDEETDTTFFTVVGPSPKLLAELQEVKKEVARILKKKGE